jgi:hypothetical protein
MCLILSIISSKVLSEVVDIPKTFDSVYGIGPGTALDQEILIFMKSRGWPERVQVLYSEHSVLRSHHIVTFTLDWTVDGRHDGENRENSE